MLKSYHAFARLTRKVTQKSISGAESFASRDVILRALAAESCGLAKQFKESDEKLSLQYMKLTAKLLGMSLRPKKLSDLDEIKKALAKLKAKEKKVGLENSSRQ